MSSINEKRSYEELAPAEVTPQLIAKKLKSNFSLDQIAPELLQQIFSFLISNQSRHPELVSYLSISKKIHQQIKNIDTFGLLMNNLLGKNLIPSECLESHLRNNFPEKWIHSLIDEERRQKNRQDSSFRLANLLTCDAVLGKNSLDSGLTKVALILSQHLNLDLDQEIKKNIEIKEFRNLIALKNEILVDAWSLPSKENLQEKDLFPICTFIKQLFNLCPSSIDNLAKTRLPLFHQLISKTLHALKSEYWNEKDRMVVIQSDKIDLCATLFTALHIILETLLKKSQCEEQQPNDDDSLYLDSPEDGNILLCFACALNDVEESSLAYHRFLALRDGASSWELKQLSKRLREDESFIIKTLKYIDVLNKSNRVTLLPFLKSKEFVITLLYESTYLFTMDDIPESLRKDPEIIFNVLIDNIAELNNIPEEAKTNTDLIRSAIQQSFNNQINYIPDFIAKNGDLFFELLRIFKVYKGNPFANLSESILLGDQFKKTAFLTNPGCLFWIPYEKSINDTPLFPSKELLIESIQIHGKRVLEILNDKNNIEAIYSGLKINPHLHIYLDDDDVLAEAVEQDPQSLAHATERLRNERSLVLKAVQKDGLTLELASEKLRNNKEVVLAAVNQNGLALNFASKCLKKDEEVVKAALNQNRLAKIFADGFQSTLETNQILFDKDSPFLDYLMLHGFPEYLIKNGVPNFIIESKGLMDDKKVILQFVQIDGKLIQHASERLKKDREIIFLAVSNDGTALAYASESLRDDKQIVMAAIQNDAQAFKFASTALKKDPEILGLLKQM